MKLQKLIPVFCFVLMLAGCGSSDDTDEETVAARYFPPTQEVKKERLKSQMTIENAYGQEIRLLIRTNDRYQAIREAPIDKINCRSSSGQDSDSGRQFIS